MEVRIWQWRGEILKEGHREREREKERGRGRGRGRGKKREKEGRKELTWMEREIKLVREQGWKGGGTVGLMVLAMMA